MKRLIGTLLTATLFAIAGSAFARTADITDDCAGCSIQKPAVSVELATKAPVTVAITDGWPTRKPAAAPVVAMTDDGCGGCAGVKPVTSAAPVTVAITDGWPTRKPAFAPVVAMTDDGCGGCAGVKPAMLVAPLTVAITDGWPTRRDTHSLIRG
jgi:hypothetical protein